MCETCAAHGDHGDSLDTARRAASRPRRVALWTPVGDRGRGAVTIVFLDAWTACSMLRVAGQPACFHCGDLAAIGPHSRHWWERSRGIPDRSSSTVTPATCTAVSSACRPAYGCVDMHRLGPDGRVGRQARAVGHLRPLAGWSPQYEGGPAHAPGPALSGWPEVTWPRPVT